MLQPLSTVWHSLGQLNVASEQDPKRVQVDRQSPQSRRVTHSYQCSVCNRLGAEKGIYDLDTKVPERGGAQHWCMWGAGYVSTHAEAPSGSPPNGCLLSLWRYLAGATDTGR